MQGASDAGLIPMFYPDYRPVESPAHDQFEKIWGVPLDPKRGLTVVEIMTAIHADQIEGMYIMGENPAMSDPDVHHARQALAKLKHLVVQDIFLTETAWHADVVLPASVFPEKTGTFTNTDRRVQLGRKALPLPGQARLDLDIIIDLANRLGCGWTYKDVGEVYTEMAEHHAVAQEHQLGAAGERGRGDLSRRRAERAGQRDPVQRRLSDQERPRQDRAGRRAAAGRDSRRRSIPSCCRPAACSSTGTPAR